MEKQYIDRRLYKVCNEYGIHARPAALLAKAAQPYDFELKITKGDSTISGRSIMGLMTLEAPKGTVLTFDSLGDYDEINAYFKELETLEDINSKTGELEQILTSASKVIEAPFNEILAKHRHIS